MSALDRVRKRFGSLLPQTDSADKSPSVGFVSPPDKDSRSFSTTGSLGGPAARTADGEAVAERAAILEYDAGFSRAEAELRAAFPLAAANCARLVTCNTCKHLRSDGAWCLELKTEVWPTVPFDCPAYVRGKP